LKIPSGRLAEVRARLVLRIGPVVVLWSVVLGPALWVLLRHFRGRQPQRAIAESK